MNNKTLKSILQRAFEGGIFLFSFIFFLLTNWPPPLVYIFIHRTKLTPRRRRQRRGEERISGTRKTHTQRERERSCPPNPRMPLLRARSKEDDSLAFSWGRNIPQRITARTPTALLPLLLRTTTWRISSTRRYKRSNSLTGRRFQTPAWRAP